MTAARVVAVRVQVGEALGWVLQGDWVALVTVAAGGWVGACPGEGGRATLAMKMDWAEVDWAVEAGWARAGALMKVAAQLRGWGTAGSATWAAEG